MTVEFYIVLNALVDSFCHSLKKCGTEEIARNRSLLRFVSLMMSSLLVLTGVIVFVVGVSENCLGNDCK